MIISLKIIGLRKTKFIQIAQRTLRLGFVAQSSRFIPSISQDIKHIFQGFIRQIFME